jgi:hypothetical protein
MQGVATGRYHASHLSNRAAWDDALAEAGRNVGHHDSSFLIPFQCLSLSALNLLLCTFLNFLCARYLQSTYKPRVPQFLSNRRNWGAAPSPASECKPPQPKEGGTNFPAGEGVGESQFGRLETKLVHCILCGATC